MILKPKSIVVVYFKADWAKRANAEAVFGLPKENMPDGVAAFPVRVLDASGIIGLWVQSIAGHEPKGNEATMLIPWAEVISVLWRPSMEAKPKELGFSSRAGKQR
jgi:hypothetical protein